MGTGVPSGKAVCSRLQLKPATAWLQYSCIHPPKTLLRVCHSTSAALLKPVLLLQTCAAPPLLLLRRLQDSFGRPGFVTVLQRVAQAWREKGEAIKQQSAESMEQLAKLTEPEVG